MKQPYFDPALFIDPAQAIAVCEHAHRANIYMARSTYQEAMSFHAQKSNDDMEWKKACALNAVFSAGMLYGVRRERAKRRRVLLSPANALRNARVGEV